MAQTREHTAVKAWLDRYSLKRSGWHRFWFSMAAVLAVGCGFWLMLPTPAESYASAMRERELCKARCQPKQGALGRVERYPGQHQREPKSQSFGPLQCICS